MLVCIFRSVCSEGDLDSLNWPCRFILSKTIRSQFLYMIVDEGWSLDCYAIEISSLFSNLLNRNSNIMKVWEKLKKPWTHTSTASCCYSISYSAKLLLMFPLNNYELEMSIA